MKVSKYNTRVGAGTLLFLIAYTLLVARIAIGNTTFIKYISIYGTNLVVIFLIGFLCISIKVIFVDRYSLRILVSLLIAIMLFLMAYRSSSYSDIIILLLLLIGTNNVKLESIVRCHFVVYLSILILAMFCSLIGIIDNYVVYSSVHGYRYSLGNTYPTDFAAGTLYLMLDFVFLKRNKWRVKYSLIMVMIACWVYRITDSNTSFILSMFISISMMLYQMKIGRKIFDSVLFRRVIELSFPLLAVFSIYIQYAYLSINRSIISIVDILLNNRIAYGYQAIKEYGLSLFGTRVNMIGLGWGTSSSEAYFYVDNGYLQLALMFGLVTLTIICLGFSFVCYRSQFFVSNAPGVFVIIMFVIAISAVIEPRLHNILYNAFILSIGIEMFSAMRKKVLKVK